MKSTLLTFLFIPCFGFGGIIFPGATVYAEFKSMEIGEIGGVGLGISFGGNLLSTGEVLRIELYENSMEEDPVYTRNFFGTEVGSSGFWHLGEIGDEIFSDFQGIVALDMKSGSVDIEHVWVGTWIDEIGYRRQITNFTAIPEPSFIGAVFGLFCLISLRYIRKC